MITDSQMAALRAALAGRSDEGVRLTRSLVETDDVDHYGRLVYAAFLAAVRRRFSPTWTVPQIIRFVAVARADLLQDGIEVDVRAAEALTRRALGDLIDVRLEDEAIARAQVFLLIELVEDADLDDDGLDAFLAEVRSLADQMIS